MIKILNLYAGIGGNRKLWTGDIQVTAIEYKPEVAAIYKDLYPEDTVIVADAHQYLLEHYAEFDFIWASPPCPSHSQIRYIHSKNEDNCKPIYPDMKLYEEIIFLTHYFKGKFVIENVIGYYEPLIKPYKIQRHYFWSNYNLTNIKVDADNIVNGNIDIWQKKLGIDLSKYDVNAEAKGLMLRNCVNPKVGLSIFENAYKNKQLTL